MAVSLTRTVGFHALHRYYRPEWSEVRNREVFGSLADPSGHGHDYQCAVTVSGSVNENGMILDLTLLDRILSEEILKPFAGKHFNLDVPAFAYGRQLPTCEAIAAYVFPRVAVRLPAGVVLERVRIMEDPTLYADCTGIA
ncbi:MAG TPA: 6-carboxytetrahydropterin synthase [Gemmatimonadales bacterium]|jgi:6-pyruvoyltetrahydropterin/6-carboxytetrahydropterin synthase